MAVPLLKTKLYAPTPRPGLVSRPHLIGRLNAGISSGCRLTLISAPAGSGKTTLLSEWVHGGNGSQISPPSVAWLSLDEEDSDPARFLLYLVSALQSACPDVGEATLSVLQSPQLPAVEAILTALINEVDACADRIVLILDDYHVISAPAVHRGVAFLVEHQPAQLHVVLSTRADPPLPISRLRARRQLSELRANDLRFTAGEATALLSEIVGLDLTPEDVSALEARTEGWVVGLQLAALSMQGRPTESAREFLQAFTGSHHYILEYLTEEVMRRQPDSVRRFLLQTSILERLCGPLCDAVTGRVDGSATLSDLHRANLFIVPLDDQHRWYRYHHLFADLLRNLLRIDMPAEQVRTLHSRASEWYEQDGTLDAAIEHALLSEDLTRAAVLTERAVGTALSHGNVIALLRWIEALPEDLVRARPGLLMYQGWAMFINGQMASAERVLHRARQALEALPSSADSAPLRGRLAAMLATLATLHQDIPKAIQEAREALAHLPEGDLVSRARATRALGAAYGLAGDTDKMIEACQEARALALTTGNTFLAADIISQIASARFHQGRLHEAARFYQQVLHLVERPAEFPPAGLGYVGLADILLEWNDLGAAQEHVNRGIELCRQGGIGHSLLVSYCTKALVKQAIGDADGALSAICRAEGTLRAAGSPLMALHLLLYQVRLRLLLDDVEAAARWVRGEATSLSGFIKRQLLPERLPVVLREAYEVCLARVHLAQGDADRVVEIYDRLAGPAQAAGRMARAIEISLLKALALEALGQPDAALECFVQCLSWAEPGGYVRLFLEGSAPVIGLLHRAAARDIAPQYVARLLGAFELCVAGSEPAANRQPTDLKSAAPLPEPLSDREREILELIGRGYSNQEIAAALTITLNTVKKHTSNIYGKLGVRSRTQAIARSQELGLP